MHIDWKRIHEEIGNDYRYLAWDENGECFVFRESPRMEDRIWYHESNNPTPWLDGQCPGDWRTTLIEFPGHYEDEVPPSPSKDGLSLETLCEYLEVRESVGIAAAKRLKHVRKANAAYQQFLSADMRKTLKAAGLELVFREVEGE